MLLQEPQLIRKSVMTGIEPAGDERIKNITTITYLDILRGYITSKDPKFYLFFSQNKNWERLAE